MYVKSIVKIAITAGLLGIAGAMPAAAADVTLRAGTFLPPNDKQWYPPIQKFLDTVNEKGKPIGLQINMVAAGGKGMSPFEMGNGLKSGVLDMIHLAGTFYNKVVPLADAQKLSTLTVQEQRANGTFAFLEPIYNEKMNAHYLGRWADDVPFHMYLNKKIDKADLTGLKIRGTSVYQAFIEKLGGTMITTPPADAYTAVERGVVDGLGWPLWGIDAWGWEKVLKYRVEPGIYWAEISMLVNLDTWKKLTKEQQDLLTNTAIGLENEFPKTREQNDRIAREMQEKAGIQVIKLEGAEAEKWVKAAYDAGWADVIKKDPVNGPKIRELTSRK